jgi:putative N-acetylmannosamine-6-phosphate epimerase
LRNVEIKVAGIDCQKEFRDESANVNGIVEIVVKKYYTSYLIAVDVSKFEEFNYFRKNIQYF